MDNSEDILYLKEYGIIFIKNSKGKFEPLYYNVNEDTREGTEVKRGDIIYDFVMFVRYAEGSMNKRTGKRNMSGYLDIYQWVMAIQSIIKAVDFKSEMMMIAIPRQAKQFWSV
jgi:hypothetical protein